MGGALFRRFLLRFLTGIGFVKQVGTSTTYTVNASYSLAESLVMATLLPKFWITLEATDKSGNIARHRRIVANTILGTTFASTAVPGIPTITAPGSVRQRIHTLASQLHGRRASNA